MSVDPTLVTTTNDATDTNEEKWLTTEKHTVTIAETIDGYVSWSHDDSGIHTSDQTARAAGFPRRILHCLAIAGIAANLIRCRMLTAGMVAAVGDIRCRLLEPVLADDVLFVKFRVTYARHLTIIGGNVFALRHGLELKVARVKFVGLGRQVTH